ncbi:hypothetical protein GCM10010252_77250 [Streptomyces aureoverticillatus]|nr:hypothetical protein GCM10010252_77250 [Streptomyces aureoverticillatus]
MSEHRGSHQKNTWRGPLLYFVEFSGTAFILQWFFTEDRDSLPVTIMWCCLIGAAVSIVFPGLARLYRWWRKRF